MNNDFESPGALGLSGGVLGLEFAEDVVQVSQAPDGQEEETSPSRATPSLEDWPLEDERDAPLEEPPRDEQGVRPSPAEYP